MIKRYGDIISSGFFIAVSIAYFIATFHFNEVSEISKGARLIPQICAVILFICAATVLYGGLKNLTLHNSSESKSGAASDQEEEEMGRPNYKKVVATLCFIALYAALFQYLGFILSTALYLVLQIFTLAEKDERKPVLIIFIAVTTSLTLYYLFTKAFTIILPSGILFYVKLPIL